MVHPCLTIASIAASGLVILSGMVAAAADHALPGVPGRSIATTRKPGAVGFRGVFFNPNMGRDGDSRSWLVAYPNNALGNIRDPSARWNLENERGPDDQETSAMTTP